MKELVDVNVLIAVTAALALSTGAALAKQVELGSSVASLKQAQVIPPQVPMPEHAPAFTGKRAHLTFDANYKSEVSDKAETKDADSVFKN